MPSTPVSSYTLHSNQSTSRHGPFVTARARRKKQANPTLLTVDKAVEYILSQPDAH